MSVRVCMRLCVYLCVAGCVCVCGVSVFGVWILGLDSQSLPCAPRTLSPQHTNEFRAESAFVSPI